MQTMKEAREQFGQFLMDCRIEKGLTQIEVAKQLRYGSAQFISNWERGLCWPPKTQYKKIAQIYGLDLGELVDAYVDVRAVELYRAFGVKPRSSRRK